MDYYSKKANTKHIATHHVLAQQCQQLDCARADDPEELSECNEVSMFERILLQENLEPEVVTDDERIIPLSEEHANNVYVTRQMCSMPSLGFLRGLCIQSPAQKSVIGSVQAKAYCSLFDIPLQPSNFTTKNLFSFGTHTHPGLRILASLYQ